MTGSNAAAPVMFDVFQLFPSTSWFMQPNRDMKYVDLCAQRGVVANLSDTITVLAGGQILAEGDYAQVSADPRVIEAYMGSESG